MTEGFANQPFDPVPVDGAREYPLGDDQPETRIGLVVRAAEDSDAVSAVRDRTAFEHRVELIALYQAVRSRKAEVGCAGGGAWV